jgi:hypothetical protein
MHACIWYQMIAPEDRCKQTEANVKRIVNGLTYNTDTATQLAQATWTNDEKEEVTGILYQTRGGAFFVHHSWIQEVWNQRWERADQRERDEVIPLSAERAQEWLMDGDVQVFHNPFSDPPEATAEDEVEQGATIYLRIPVTLKDRVERKAEEASLSTNAWAMRCLEQCLGKDR